MEPDYSDFFGSGICQAVYGPNRRGAMSFRPLWPPA
jgi:hypothetical protein